MGGMDKSFCLAFFKKRNPYDLPTIYHIAIE